jgi:hypothetical protein
VEIDDRVFTDGTIGLDYPGLGKFIKVDLRQFQCIEEYSKFLKSFSRLFAIQIAAVYFYGLPEGINPEPAVFYAMVSIRENDILVGGIKFYPVAEKVTIASVAFGISF